LEGLISLLELIRNSLSTLFVRGVLGAGRILILLLIARGFEPAEFGIFILVFSFVEVSKAIAEFGIDTVSIREFTKVRSSQRFLETLLFLKLGTATGAYLLSFLLFWFIYGKGIDLFLICAMSLYTSALFGAFSSFFQSQLKMDRIVKAATSSTLSYLIFITLGVAFHLPLPFLMIAIPLSELINLIMVVRIYRQTNSLNLGFRGSLLSKLLKKSLPVGIAGLLIMLYSRMDTLLLGYILSDKEVGEYGVAYRFIEPFLLISGAFSISVYSSLSRTLKENRSISEIRGELRRTFYPPVLFSLLISLLLYHGSDFLVALVSKKYIFSSQALEILAIALFLKTINMQLTSIINAKGRYGVITGIAGINLAVNLSLNLLLIPKYHIMGAAMAVTLTEVMNTAIQSFYIYKRL
jgi:O-antigen/teichoic acid export membrane protein